MRTKTLTIKTIGIYKIVVLLLLAVLTGAIINYHLSSGSKLIGLSMIAMYGYYFYRIWKGMKLLKEVSYDDRSLYVKEKDFEIEIPLYRIKEVTLFSIDGIYKFELIDNDQFGNTVFCKPSIWYPFTYKRVDEELRQIRKNIAKVKEEYWKARQATTDPALPGMNI
ncbi:MAG: hypothetical protein WBA74_18860 [Cyclobacteriaceae bacterium]